MKEEVLYTPEELSKILKLSKYTVYEMIKRGDIEAHKIGRSIRISDTQLETYMLKTRKEENVYDVNIITEEGCKYGVVNDVKISISTTLSNGTAKISIRPEDVILSRGVFECSARNMLKGKVTDLIHDELSAKILLNVGFPMIVLITKQSMVKMDIKKGDELYAIFKTMTVRVL